MQRQLIETLALDMRLHERDAYRRGFRFVCGIDEAGRGPLAGPVVAAAVVLPKTVRLPGVTDSKKLTAEQREQFSKKSDRERSPSVSGLWTTSKSIG